MKKFKKLPTGAKAKKKGSSAKKKREGGESGGFLEALDKLPSLLWVGLIILAVGFVLLIPHLPLWKFFFGHIPFFWRDILPAIGTLVLTVGLTSLTFLAFKNLIDNGGFKTPPLVKTGLYVLSAFVAVLWVSAAPDLWSMLLWSAATLVFLGILTPVLRYLLGDLRGKDKGAPQEAPNTTRNPTPSHQHNPEMAVKNTSDSEPSDPDGA